jgi:hypothetical protein
VYPGCQRQYNYSGNDAIVYLHRASGSDSGKHRLIWFRIDGNGIDR